MVIIIIAAVPGVDLIQDHWFEGVRSKLTDYYLYYFVGDLNRHVRTIHLRSATYKCSECEKQFSKEPALIQHQFMCHGVIQNSKKKIKYVLLNICSRSPVQSGEVCL